MLIVVSFGLLLAGLVLFGLGVWTAAGFCITNATVLLVTWAVVSLGDRVTRLERKGKEVR